MANIERTGIRDFRLSQRHRIWGNTLYATDIDFIEADKNAMPVGLFEFKHENIHSLTTNNFQFRIIRNLANMSKLPAFAVIRSDDFSWFMVEALNDLAEAFVGSKPVKFSEFQLINLLHDLRKKEER